MRSDFLCSTHLKMDYFKIILGVILLAFFSIHVYFELRKFFRQDTTLTFTRAEVNQMKFPAVSFCARNPFKTNILTKLGYPVDLWTNIPSGNSTVNLFDCSCGSFLNVLSSSNQETVHGRDFETVSEQDDVWRETTFSVEELVSHISLRRSNGTKVFFDVKVHQNDDIRLLEHSTYYLGRCYSIIPKIPAEKQARTFLYPLNRSGK